MNKMLLLFTVFSFSTVYAQEHSFGVNVGGTLSNIERDGFDIYEPTFGWNFDCNYRLQKKRFVTKTAVGFQHKGFQITLIYVDEAGNVLGEGGIETTRFSYLGISQLAGLQFGNKIYGALYLGLNASYYLDTRLKSDQFELNNGSLVSGYSYTFSNLKPFDLSGVIESEVGFKIDEGKDIILSGSYNHGLLAMNYKTTPTIAPWKNHYYSLRLGMRIHLEKKEEKPMQE